MPAKKKSSNKKPKATGYKVFTLDLPARHITKQSAEVLNQLGA